MDAEAPPSDGWMKIPTHDLDVSSCGGFTVGRRGRLYFKAPSLRPAAIDAIVWRLDRDGVVFRFIGTQVAPPPLEIVPRECQYRLSNSLIWTWEDTHRA
jgi:hypothetical protein